MPTRTNRRTGEVQEFRDGQWVTVTPGRGGPAFTVPSKPADPRLPYQVAQDAGQAAAAPYIAPKAQADAAIAQANAGVAPAVASAEAQKAVADAQKAQAELEKLREEQKKVDPKSGAYKALQDQIDRVGELYRQQLQGGLPNVFNMVIPDFVQPKVDAFDSAAQGLVNPFMAAFKVPGQGSQSDTELRQFLQANTPSQGDSDAVIEEKLRNIQTRLNAEQPNASPVGGADQRAQFGLAGNSKTRSEIDPALQATGTRVGKMLSDGASDGEIMKFLRDSGVDPANTNIGQALKHRKTLDFKRWQRANPGASYPIGPDFYTKQVPMSGARQLFNKTAATDAGGAVAAGLAASADAISGGRLDNVVGALSGDPAMAQTGMQLLRTNHPVASFAGDVAGQGSLEALASLVPGARALVATRLGRRGADAAYGAYAGSDQGLEGAAEGALTNLGFGMAGRSLQRGVGRAATGVRNANLGYLNDEGVPLTLGQIGRGSDNIVGNAVGGIEERAVGLPIFDAIIGSARQRGDEGFNRAMFRQIGEPVGVTGSGAIGIPGLAEARRTRNAAYSFLDNARLQRDPAYDAANAVTAAKVAPLPDFNGQVGRKLDLVNNAFDPNGVLTGRNWQNSIRSLRGDRGKIARKEFGQEAADLLGEAESNLSGLVQRQLPNGVEDLAKANKVNANFKTAQAALKGRVAQRRGVLTDPTTLNDASINGAIKFGGIDNALEGNRPFFRLTEAGMDVMPNLTPDSGTAGRSLFYAALPSLLGGGAGGLYGAASDDTSAAEGAAMGAGIGAGATIIPTAAVTALYSKTGQKAIQRALLGKRNRKVEKIGDFLINNPRLAGLLGSAIGRDLFLQPELPE